MGRNRIRTDQENSVYDKEYQKVYKQERQNREAEYFKFYIAGLVDEGAEAEYYFDNIKLVYRE